MRPEPDRTRPSDRPRRIGGAFAIALLAALLLASGVSKVFVVCLGPHGTGRPHVAFVHPTCCAQQAKGAQGAHAGHGSVPAATADDGVAHEGPCIDLRLPGFEGAPDASPTPPVPPVEAPAALALALPPVLAHVERAHAPATGPPRADERARLRRVIVLQV